MMNVKQKREAITRMSTDAIRHIVEHPRPPETPSPEFPLGGLVHIEGIGNVTLDQLRAELAGRS
jgi:hypothetical protein